MRRLALEIAQAGLAAADGGMAVRKALKPTADGIEINDRLFPLGPGGRLIVLGGGKATLPIAKALDEILGERIHAGVIVLQRHQESETTDLENLELLFSGHPLPSGDSVKAAERIWQLAGPATSDDLVITCFTGGRSALVSLPPEEVGFDDKRKLNELLIASGMSITEINTVRKHVSRIKGGRLAERIAPGRIVNLTVSDVAGDQLDVLADLTNQDRSTPKDAAMVLDRYGLLDRIPESVAAHLGSEAAWSPDLDVTVNETVMLANGRSACDAMTVAARSRGLRPVVVSNDLEGEAAEVGSSIARLAVDGPQPSPSDLSGEDRPAGPYPPGSVLIGCGGESTVSLGEATLGRGGPNQEATLAAALALEGHPVVAVFLDTDGSDGGTGAAGAICDGETASRARKLGLDLAAAIRSHTSAEPLDALGDLIRTGPTGTNVNDLFVIVIGSENDETARYGDRMKRNPIIDQLESEALDPSQILLGDPQVSSVTLFRGDGCEAGLWRITPGEVTDVEAKESFLVIEGRAVIEYSDGRSFTVGPGDTHRFQGGEETVWKVEQTLLKAWWIES